MIYEGIRQLKIIGGSYMVILPAEYIKEQNITPTQRDILMKIKDGEVHIKPLPLQSSSRTKDLMMPPDELPDLSKL